MKRVLLLVVDGCTSRLMRPLVDAGTLPTFAALIARGTIRWDCASIFPSITPAATASIVTGRYPREHGIAGMSWWNPETDDVSYFGDDVMTVLKRGAGEFLRSFMHQLNDERLRAPTLFQTVERQGLKAGCINHLIFRGDVAHEVNMPLLLRLWPSMPSRLTVHGPSMLALGDFVSDRPGGALDADGGMLHRFGMDDRGTAQFLSSLEGPEALPDFTVAYFADYDFDAHDSGPDDALETLQTLDAHLARIFEAWGGLDRVLEQTCVMMTADHSHSIVGGDGDAGIPIAAALEQFDLADAATGWTDGRDVMVCPNMRAAEILLRRPSEETIARITRVLVDDERVDQVIWKHDDSDAAEISVATHDRGTLTFRALEDGGGAGDAFGGRWQIRGDLSAVDASIDDGVLVYNDYPNALERIAAGLEHGRGGRMWATARPGYEFDMTGQGVHHRAGSHGTLHALDSLVPLLVAGAPSHLDVPSAARIVDAAPLCLAALGLAVDVAPGETHALAARVTRHR